MRSEATLPRGAAGDDPLGADRAQLFAIAYRLLGSVADAEDVLQEASLRVQRAAGVASRGAWLTTVVTRLCLDRLKSAAHQRETYVGPWLPEPLLTDSVPPPAQDERVGLAESVSLAFLVLLERLSPLERAAFLLHEVFDAPFAEVASVLERDETACRQLYHRAKAHLAAGRPRFEAPDASHARLTATFLHAVSTGDVAALEALLADDVVTFSDGGGKATAARRPVQGREHVAKFLLGLGRRATPDLQVEARTVNAQPGFVLRGSGWVIVMVLDIAEERIRSVRIQLNPDKLRHFA